MDETTFRILDTLSRQLGNPLSIYQLTSRIKESHGRAYYANIYQKLHALAKEDIIILRKVGRSSIASLNFANYLLIDLLTEMELRKKREFLSKAKAMQILLMDLEERCRKSDPVVSTSLINPERNFRLNRAELLILMRNSKDASTLDELISIYATMRELQSAHNIRLDFIALTTSDFTRQLGSEETNPIREMVSNEIGFYSPQAFWTEMAEAARKLRTIRLEEHETNPAKIAERDIVYNLARFGYKEIGPQISEGRKICIEYVATSLLMQNDARRIEAIPVMLAKKEANYRLFIFLSQKYGVSGRLLGLLKALNGIKPTKETSDAIALLQALKTKETKADQKSIEEKMRLYNAIR